MFGRVYYVFTPEDHEDFDKNHMEYILSFLAEDEDLSQCFSGTKDEYAFFTNKRIIFFLPDEGNSMYNDCKIKFINYLGIQSYTVNGSTQDNLEPACLEIKFIDEDPCIFNYNKGLQAEYTVKLIGAYI